MISTSGVFIITNGKEQFRAFVTEIKPHASLENYFMQVDNRIRTKSD